jgi:hypothetical protein
MTEINNEIITNHFSHHGRVIKHTTTIKFTVVSKISNKITSVS